MIDFRWQSYVIYVLPFIGALIGWLTNYIAIKMLFHPREEKRILGVRLQGVFPRRQQALAKKVGEVVATELVSGEDISRAMKDKARSKELARRARIGRIVIDAAENRRGMCQRAILGEAAPDGEQDASADDAVEHIVMPENTVEKSQAGAKVGHSGPMRLP